MSILGGEFPARVRCFLAFWETCSQSISFRGQASEELFDILGYHGPEHIISSENVVYFPSFLVQTHPATARPTLTELCLCSFKAIGHFHTIDGVAPQNLDAIDAHLKKLDVLGGEQLDVNDEV